MPNDTTDNDDSRSLWDDVRRIADELKLKVHLGGMEARDQWAKLQPTLMDLEQKVESGATRAGDAISEQMATLGASLRKLLADLGDKPGQTGRSDEGKPTP
ncbi:MAG: hypothetical protein M3680_21340 [Myxococcota bacterium]|nr:hypothetical protein [Myxococcota bacterium]